MKRKWTMMKCSMLVFGLMMVVSFGGVVDAVESEAEMAARIRPSSLDQAVIGDVETDGLTMSAIPHRSEGESNLKWATPDPLVTDPTREEAKPSIASAPNGDLFVAVDELTDGWVQIYRSLDGGQSWANITGFKTGTNSRNPALAYAENSGDTWLVLVYEVVTSDFERALMSVHVDPYNTADWTAVSIDSSIPWADPGTELHPQIVTDFPRYLSSVYYYVTYAIPSVDYYPVFFSRSTDRGDSWDTPVNITGGSENTGYETRPEIAYSAHRNDIYVAFNKPGWTGSEWAPQVWVTNNTSVGNPASWETPVQVTSSSRDDLEPSVAVAWESDTVMVAWTSVYGVDDSDVRISYSTDGGTVWSPPQSLPNWTFEREDNVDLAVSQAASGRFHAVYRHNLAAPEGGDIWYQWADVSSPGSWSAALDVDDGSTASGHSYYPRPAICVDLSRPPAEEASFSWTSYGGTHYGAHFDSVMLGDFDMIFADGFESGNVLRWSSSSP